MHFWDLCSKTEISGRATCFSLQYLDSAWNFTLYRGPNERSYSCWAIIKLNRWNDSQDQRNSPKYTISGLCEPHRHSGTRSSNEHTQVWPHKCRVQQHFEPYCVHACCIGKGKRNRATFSHLGSILVNDEKLNFQDEQSPYRYQIQVRHHPKWAGPNF